MKLSITIPDERADELAALHAKNLGIETPEDVKAFLEKAIQHTQIDILRRIVVAQKEQEAMQAIQSDPTIAESDMEKEVKAKKAAEEEAVKQKDKEDQDRLAEAFKNVEKSEK